VSRPSPEQYLASLAQIRDSALQQAYISNSGVAPSLELIESLSLRIRDLCPKDPALAEVFVETNLYLAGLVDIPAGWAYAYRSRAHVLYTMRRCIEAQPFFERAVDLFSESELNAEAGRTMVGEMDNLSFLSRFEEATRLEQKARAALEKAQDSRYLTTLEIALGNLYYRLNRYEESLIHYQSALMSSDNPVSTAAAGMGRAHVFTDMNRFDEAIEAFKRIKEHCEQHGLALWTDIADRGISRMHFLRGNYSTALRMIEEVRRRHEAANDSRRVAYCDLDRSEIYLQLNLFEEASTLSTRAHETFENLGNRHEAAMSLMFLGIAEFKLFRDAEADQAFLQSHEIFSLAGNETWCAAVDLWRSQLLIRQQKFAGAQELAERSAEAFDKQHVPVRAANARVLSAQSLQELEQPENALAHAKQALAGLEGFHAPWVSYQAFNTLGRLKELAGSTHEAETCYLRAVDELESLRGSIRLDELRMSFGKDKYQVYENIVNLQLNRDDNLSAFDFVERSKSRTLIDLLERNLETVWDAGAGESPRIQRIRKCREELNILYNRLNGDGTAARSTASDKKTRSEIASREHELMELLREVASEKSGWVALQTMELPHVHDVQKMLEPDEILLEYYTVADRFQVFIIGRNQYHVVRDLTTFDAIRTALKGLSFQLSKFQLQSAYVSRHSAALLAAIRHHLKDLYQQLIAPLRQIISPGQRLIVVPHQVLHYVPFHALYDGERHIIDDHELTYGASASVLKICRERKPANSAKFDLILAVADELTPYINDEVAALQELLPNAKVFVGPEAREDKLRQYASDAGKIHIAAHGVFRADSPMFSSLKLGDSWLNLFDIFNLQLGAELTTLSACETGMSAVWEGDELLGLARGFLYAGTPSLVVSLWTVNDRSTAQLMGRFYKGLRDGLSKSRALKDAILEVKDAFPHPYYWAPFILLGKS
jgi:CHAT domain-containing protein/tetratricopeptide (TPR) repeat protein